MKTGYGFKTVWQLKEGNYVPTLPLDENDWYKPKEKRYGNGTKENTTEKELDCVSRESETRWLLHTNHEGHLHTEAQGISDAFQSWRGLTR